MTINLGIFTRQHNLPTLISIVGCLLASGYTSAESIRFSDGQAYSAERFRNFTLEGGYFGNDERVWTGGRLTLPTIGDYFTLFADLTNNDGEQSGIAFGESVDYSGSGEGAGVYIEGLPNWQDMALALRLSRNIESSEVESNIAVGGQQATVKLRTKAITAALLLSPVKPMFDNGGNGYLSVGVTQNRYSRTVAVGGIKEGRLNERDKEFHPYLAAGLSFPLRRVSFYGAIVYEDSFTAGLGLRVILKRTIKKES